MASKCYYSIQPWCTGDRGTITGEKQSGYVRRRQEGGMVLDLLARCPSAVQGDLIARCDEMNEPERERGRGAQELLFLAHIILAACASLRCSHKVLTGIGGRAWGGCQRRSTWERTPY